MDPPDHKPLEKQSVSRLSYLFANLDLLSSSPFSGSSHLCFSSVHIVGSLTSKLPSMIYLYIFHVPAFGISKRSPVFPAISSHFQCFLHLPGLSSLKLQLLRLEYPEASALKALRTAATWKPAKPSDPWAAGGENSVGCCNHLGALLGAREQLWDG